MILIFSASPKNRSKGTSRIPRHTGHWLGMDVHDVGAHMIGDDWRVLEPGMARTIAPGIYIPAGARAACLERTATKCDDARIILTRKS